ncbi:MAG: slipin family protein [Eggerthellaceae bacterium]|nr:slipin family protein [Eggerthellaceae bacterium]
MFNRRDDKAPAPVDGRAGYGRADVEFGVPADSYRSDRDKRSSRLGAVALQVVFALVLFAVVLGAWWFAFDEVTLAGLVVAVAVALLGLSSIHVALDWERYVVLRGGRYHRLGGPGVFFTIPLIEYCTLRVDQRTQVTAFGAEETLTADVVPLDVDAVLYWVIWDPEKACTEVEDCCFAVALTAQTALRDAIGRANASDVIMRRDQLDSEIRAAIEGRVADWGITVLDVEVRNILIPRALQDVMSREAQAERLKSARMTLLESERTLAELLHEAADVYREDPIAYDLRKMHLVHEGMTEDASSLVVPSAYTEGFSDKGRGAAE